MFENMWGALYLIAFIILLFGVVLVVAEITKKL